jgi:predicted dehydrogenase
MTFITRRGFVQGASAAALAAQFPHAFDQDAPTLKVGLVGCGGRGTGAAENCLHSASNIQLVALADMFEDRLTKCRERLAAENHPGFRVTDEKCFLGFDAYRRLIDSGVDLVLLCTPPGFRPLHFAAAIDAGKHVFFEKPVCVDPVGARKVIEWGEKAREKKLAVVAGTQGRHTLANIEAIRRIREGAIGRILAVRSIRLGQGVWEPKPREAGWDDMTYQLRNWYYYTWLSGDFIVEQHVHQQDHVNWILDAVPLRAFAIGGRMQRVDPKYGHIYDNIAVEYEYPGGVRVTHIGRQMERCANEISVTAIGDRGVATFEKGPRITGAQPWTFEGKSPTPEIQEHTDLIESIRAGKPLNEARRIAESSLTSIIGREAAYTGKRLEWNAFLNSDQDLLPERLAFGPLPSPPVAVPGRRT